MRLLLPREPPVCVSQHCASGHHYVNDLVIWRRDRHLRAGASHVHVHACAYPLGRLPALSNVRTEQCANGGARDASFYAPFQTAFHPSVVGGGLSYLIVESIVYLALAVGFDFALRNPRLRRIIDREPPPLTEAELAAAAAPADEDDDVKAERLRISKLIESGANVKDDVVLLNRLRKVYRGGKQAVRALSFGLPSGEVFGFLGINGAGKTSALKMLSGDIMPSSGAAQLAGLDIITQQLQVRRLLGCELRTTRILQPSSVPNLYAFCPFHSSFTIRLPAV
jgi:ABC transporter